MLAVLLFLTCVRAPSLIAAPLSVLISVIVAFPTERLFDTAWLVAALAWAGVYVLTTGLFGALSRLHIAAMRRRSDHACT